MRTIATDVLIQLAAGELSPFQLLSVSISGTTYYYTDCDVPIGSQINKTTITNTPAVHGLSLADGQAFARFGDLDLSQFEDSGYLLTVHDSASKTAVGYIDAAGGGETLGGELLSNPGFETAGAGGTDVFANWNETSTLGSSLIEQADDSIHGGTYSAKLTNVDTNVQVNTGNIAVTPGALYKISFWTRGDGTKQGYYRIYDATNTTYITGYLTTGVTGTDWAEVVHYVTAPAGCVNLRLYLWLRLVGVCYYDDVSIQEVTDCAVDGGRIVSTEGGATEGWTIEAGFNYNDTEYVATISDHQYIPFGFKHNGAQYSMSTIVDRLSLEFDNLGNTFTSVFVGGNPQGSVVTLKEIVLDENNQVIGNPVVWFVGTIDDWDIDEERLRVNVVGPNYAWARHVAGRHPSLCRWKTFGGDECEYSGSILACNRTYTACSQRNNTNNFGGFRWLPKIQDRVVSWGRPA